MDGDLYALSVTFHEWLVGCRPTQGSEYKGDAPPAIVKWLLKGCSPETEQCISSVLDMRLTLQARGAEAEPSLSAAEKPGPQEPVCIAFAQKGGLTRIPLYLTLNSLHSRSAASENTLAESQARNQFFGFVYIHHPVAHVIQDVLAGDDRTHVVRTGTVVDGESTIAVEIL